MCCGGDCLGMTATRGLTTGYVLRNSLLGDLVVVVQTSQSALTQTSAVPPATHLGLWDSLLLRGY